MNLSENSIEFSIKNLSFSNKQENIIHNKNSRKNKLKLINEEYQEKIILWNLSRFEKDRNYDGIEWQYQSSRDQLNNRFSAENILKLLNSKSVLENYLPQENDFLKIWLEYKYPSMHNKSRPYISDYISFLYDYKWKLNKGFDHIDFEYKVLYEGEIKIL